MLAIIDVNIIFSALINKGVSFEVFKKNNLFKKHQFIAPEFMFLELDSKKKRLLKESQITENEINETISFIKKQISTIPASEFKEHLPKAIRLNEKDAPYLALAMKMDSPIISGDKELKNQASVKVISPKEFLANF